MKIFLLMLLALPAHSKGPSIGISYSQMDLREQAYSTMNIYQSFYQRSIMADIRYPFLKRYCLSVSGGKTDMLLGVYQKNYVLQSVATDSSGNIIGTYGESSIGVSRQSLSGYTIGFSFRIYLGDM